MPPEWIPRCRGKPSADVVDVLGGQPGRQLDLITDGLRVAGIEILGETVDLSLG